MTIWERELIRYTRDRGRIFTTLFQPIMFLVVFGTGFRTTFAQAQPGLDYFQFMFPGILAMNIMGTAFFSSISTVWDREFGFLKEILVAPVSRMSIAAGKTLGATTIAAGQALVLFLLAPVIGVAPPLLALPLIFVFMLLIAFAISGLGLLVASLIRSIENFGLLMNLLVFPMFFLSGAFFPLSNVPVWMKLLSRLDPLSYGVDAMRQLLLSSKVEAAALAQVSIFPVAWDAVFLAAFSVAMLSAAVFAFAKRG
ncbi:MAG: ABC transporter permease [Candidatus Terrybacteria bacterium]|nr:ABC transporter permease [Candidatus Terrybacteria bacterium]